MQSFTDQLIAVIDRVLWASRMASLTSPTYWGRSIHGAESSPWMSSIRGAERALRPDDVPRQARGASQTKHAALSGENHGASASTRPNLLTPA